MDCKGITIHNFFYYYYDKNLRSGNIEYKVSQGNIRKCLNVKYALNILEKIYIK